MEKITLNPELRAKLNGLNQQLEVCDEKGNTVGQFVPQGLYQQLMVAWAKTQFTDEELEQARRELKNEGGYTTPEALAFVEKLIREAKGTP